MRPSGVRVRPEQQAMNDRPKRLDPLTLPYLEQQIWGTAFAHAYQSERARELFAMREINLTPAEHEARLTELISHHNEYARDFADETVNAYHVVMREDQS
jgi:hypothetical protein